MPSISTSIGIKIKKLRSLFLSRSSIRRLKNEEKEESSIALLHPEYELIDSVSDLIPNNIQYLN